MKKRSLCGLLSLCILFTSCIGSFSAFNNVLDWNERVTDNKFANELLFVAMWIVPVYQISIFADAVVFNTIEFWTGDNPISMEEGESDTQIVSRKGNTYKITASKNQFHVSVIEGSKKGEEATLVYLPKHKSWNLLQENGDLKKLSSLKKGLLMAYMPNGENLSLDASQGKLAVMAKMESAIEEYNCTYWAEQ